MDRHFVPSHLEDLRCVSSEPVGRLDKVRSLGSVPQGQDDHDEDRAGFSEKSDSGYSKTFVDSIRLLGWEKELQL
jgi:hypothetical protein